MKIAHFRTLLLLLTVCWYSSAIGQNYNGPAITGQGEIVKKKLNVDNFHSLGLGINATVYLTQGSSHSVEIEAQQNIIDNLELEVENGSWNIKGKKRIKDYKSVVIHITMPTVKALSIGGSGKILGKSDFKNLEELKVSIGGSGEVSLAGSATTTSISIAGSGKVDVRQLGSASSKVSIAGSGDAFVDVKDKLTVSIAGSGSVFYNGKPSVKTSVAGSGKVESL
jgi:uncharacterized protein YggL (DUF469 family)